MAISFRTRRSLRNPLIRRVQRHADLATLFRSPQVTSPEAGLQPAGLSPGRFAEPLAPEGQTPDVPVVRATLVPVAYGTEAAEMIAPTSPAENADQTAQVQPADAQQPGEAAPATPTGQRPAVPRASTPTLQRRPEPAAQPSQEEQRRAAVQATTPAPAEAAGSEGEDRVWDRLQAIFRKHQEKEAQEPAPKAEDIRQPQEPTEAQVQTKPGDQSSHIQEEKNRRAAEPGLKEPSSGEAMQKEAAAPGHRHVGSSPEAEPAESRIQEDQVQQHSKPPRLEEVAESDQPIEEVEEEAAEGVEATEVQAGRGEVGLDETQVVKPASVQRDEAPQTAAAEAKPEPAPQQEELQAAPPAEPEESDDAEARADQEPPKMALPGEAASTYADQTVVTEARLTDRTAPAGMPSQRTPGEPAALPADVFEAPEVEGMERQQDTRSLPLEEAWPVQRLAEEARPPAEPSQPAASSKLARSPEARQVSSLLKGVTPGQPTDSQVEVVTPRRPRPTTAVQTLRQERAVETAHEKQAEDSATSAAESKQEHTAPEESEAPLIRAASAAAETPKMASLVPTEIGDLPADLWQLIGQEPPQPSPAGDKPAAPVQRQEEAGPETALSTGVPAVDEKRAAGPIFTYQAGPGLQRQEAVGATASEAAAPEEQAGDEAGGEDEETNLDELSRRVYQEVKRRLAHEWERMRRKL